MNLAELNEIRFMLNSESYKENNEAIKKLLRLDKIDDDLMNFILGLEDKLLVAEFLQNYNHFSAYQLDILEEFIKDNLKNEDKLFLSELIGIANSWNIVSIYNQCLDYINDNEEDSMVILESIYMVYEHLEIDLIEEVFSALTNVINSKEYYQNCQIVAAFYLLRISGHEEYLNDVIDYAENGQAINRQILANVLKREYNQQKYFCYHERLLIIAKSNHID